MTIHYKFSRLLFVATLFLASCKVMLVGAYDQVTDQGIQKVQTDVSTILVKLERNLVSGMMTDNEYAKFKPAYETIAGEIAVLKIRCNALPKYKLVSEQLVLLESNVKSLEELHKYGFKTVAEVSTVKSGFEVQFTAMIKLQNALKREK